jgi:hypothetical protein
MRDVWVNHLREFHVLSPLDKCRLFDEESQETRDRYHGYARSALRVLERRTTPTVCWYAISLSISSIQVSSSSITTPAVPATRATCYLVNPTHLHFLKSVNSGECVSNPSTDNDCLVSFFIGNSLDYVSLVMST